MSHQNESYLWGITLSTGNQSACGGMSSEQLATTPLKAVFNTLTASWSVEWNGTDNLLRSMLANDGYGLTISWNPGPGYSGIRYYQSMGLGATIGEVRSISQDIASGAVYVQDSLLGDPTLRQQIVAPVSGAGAVENGNDVVVSWSASPDAYDDGSEDYEGIFVGYLIYRYDNTSGGFVRLTDAPITENTYMEAGAAADAEDDLYMIRTVKLEETRSGGFYNASQGIFCSPDDIITSDIHINVAGSAIVDGNWERDSAVMPSEYCESNRVALWTTDSIDLTGVATNLAMGMFQSAHTSDMEWNFNVGANQMVAVDLYFAEIGNDVDSVGNREFDVDIEGITVLDNYDIFDEAGGVSIAIMETFNVTVGADGILDVDLSSVIGTPILCGIQIRVI